MFRQDNDLDEIDEVDMGMYDAGVEVGKADFHNQAEYEESVPDGCAEAFLEGYRFGWYQSENPGGMK